jgi:hypothetical protein
MQAKRLSENQYLSTRIDERHHVFTTVVCLAHLFVEQEQRVISSLCRKAGAASISRARHGDKTTTPRDRVHLLVIRTWRLATQCDEIQEACLYTEEKLHITAESGKYCRTRVLKYATCFSSSAEAIPASALFVLISEQ